MGKKKMNLIPFQFKSKEMAASSSSSSSWPWPTCSSPKTLSFRANNDLFFKTMNCTYVDSTTNNNNNMVDTPDLYSSNSYECASFSSVYREEEEEEEEAVETVIRGLRSERLIFEEGETSSSSILEKAKMDDGFPFKESVAMAVDSRDPFVDFRISMEEMVEAHGLKDWEGLEDLLSCYLRVNGKSNHGYIVGAFVDLLVGLAFAADFDSTAAAAAAASTSDTHDSSSTSSSSMAHSFTSPLSFSSITSPSLSLVEVDDQSTEKSVDNASSSDV